MAERNCVVASDIYFDNMLKDDLDTFRELAGRAWDGTVFIVSMPTYIPSKNKNSFNALVKRIEKSEAYAALKNSIRRLLRNMLQSGQTKTAS